MKGSFIVALAAALVLAQGADAAQTKKSATSKSKVAATKTLKKKKKLSKTTQSASTMSASEAALAASSSSAVALPAAPAAGTTTAKASTTVTTLADRIGMDFYNFGSTNMRAMNTEGSVVNTTDNYVGVSYKLNDGSKIYLRQQYGFNVPGTGPQGAKIDDNDSMKMRAEDIYLRWQNSKLLQVMNDGSIGLRVTATAPTGEPSRTDAKKAHHGKLSSRVFIVKPVNKVFSWDYLIQGGLTANANKGVRNDEGELKGTKFASYVQNLGLNANVGSGFTLTQGIGSSGTWSNETEEFGIEQTNNLELSTSVAKEIGAATFILGVSQSHNIKSDGGDVFSTDDLYDDEKTDYYFEFVLSI